MGISRLPMSARKMIAEFATMVAFLQIAKQKQHRYQKILAPGKKEQKNKEFKSFANIRKTQLLKMGRT